MSYEKPKIIATFTEQQILEQQQDLEAEGWGSWSSK